MTACPPAARAFSYHRRVAPLLWAFVAIALIEAVVAHLLIGIWSRTAAWLLSAIGGVTLLFMLRLALSLKRRPILIDAGVVRVRAGSLYDFAIPVTAIRGVRVAFSGDALRARGTLKTSLLAWPNLILDLAAPLPSPRPFGLGAPVDTVAVALDEPDAFVAALIAAAPHLDPGPGNPAGPPRA